jgi:hypothetical protein
VSYYYSHRGDGAEMTYEQAIELAMKEDHQEEDTHG